MIGITVFMYLKTKQKPLENELLLLLNGIICLCLSIIPAPKEIKLSIRDFALNKELFF